jgi:hypothetical protein
MKSKKIALALWYFFLAAPSHSAVSVEVLCFGSHPSVAGERFELRTYYDPITRWRGGFIRYSTSNELIYAIPTSKTETIISEDRPYDTTTIWAEFRNGKITGEYKIGSQGAVIYSITYTNYTTKKERNLYWDSNISTSLEKGCEWD